MNRGKHSASAQQRAVFVDESGRRALWARIGLRGAVLVCLAGLVVLAVSVLGGVGLPGLLDPVALPSGEPAHPRASDGVALPAGRADQRGSVAFGAGRSGTAGPTPGTGRNPVAGRTPPAFGGPTSAVPTRTTIAVRSSSAAPTRSASVRPTPTPSTTAAPTPSRSTGRPTTTPTHAAQSTHSQRSAHAHPTHSPHPHPTH